MLVAIIVRIVLFVLACIIELLGFFEQGSLSKLAETIGGFDTFVWKESWCYWIIVIVVTFIGEMGIWEEEG